MKNNSINYELSRDKSPTFPLRTKYLKDYFDTSTYKFNINENLHENFNENIQATDSSIRILNTNEAFINIEKLGKNFS